MSIFEDDDINTPLCCCEYYNENQERTHICEICCDCYELDDCCDKLICCNFMSMPEMRLVLYKIQDRFRVPWTGGAKQLSFDAISAIIVLPTLLMLATLHPFLAFGVTVLILIMLRCIYVFQTSHQIHSKFFQMWTITSILLIWFVFEFMGQPFLEITMGENIAFNVLFNLAIFSIYICRKGRVKSTEAGKYASEMEEVLIKDDEYVYPKDDDLETQCRNCRTNKEDRAKHCHICQTCIPSLEYHNVWFDCCIGKENRRSYFCFLLFAVSALSFGSNLQLTTVCNSFNFYKTILMPYDCSEVYDQWDLTVCFVLGVYCLMVALFLLYFLIQQIWFISFGITGNEWRRFSQDHRWSIFVTPRPHSKGFFRNWYHFILKH